MAYHHLAIASRDMQTTHDFYTKAMGFDLVKVEVAKTPAGGWAKHFFYETGDGELMAFWELHDDALPSDFPTGLSEAAGLPPWVNHVAFKGTSIEDLKARAKRWLEYGCDVLEIDHHWCYSVYATDPGGTLVEFCLTTADFTDEDRAHAEAALTRDDLEFGAPPIVKVHKASGA